MDKEEIIERLEEIAKHAVHVLGEEPFFMSLDDGIAIHEAIDILKSAQPERKKGKWIKDAYGTVICSKCKGIRRDNRVGHIEFCNSCGADMREKHEDN